MYTYFNTNIILVGCQTVNKPKFQTFIVIIETYKLFSEQLKFILKEYFIYFRVTKFCT